MSLYYTSRSNLIWLKGKNQSKIQELSPLAIVITNLKNATGVKFGWNWIRSTSSVAKGIYMYIHILKFSLFSQSSPPKQGLLKHAKTDGNCQLVIMDKYSRQCQLTDLTYVHVYLTLKFCFPNTEHLGYLSFRFCSQWNAWNLSTSQTFVRGRVIWQPTFPLHFFNFDHVFQETNQHSGGVRWRGSRGLCARKPGTAGSTGTPGSGPQWRGRCH